MSKSFIFNCLMGFISITVFAIPIYGSNITSVPVPVKQIIPDRGTEALCKEQGGRWNDNDIGQCWCKAGEQEKILPFDLSVGKYITNCVRIQYFTAKCEGSVETGGVGGVFYPKDSVNRHGVCVCPNETEFVADDSFFGQNKCGPKATAKSNAVASAKSSSLADCIQELQEKVGSCDSSASTAVNKCDSKSNQSSGNDDTINKLQEILGGASKYMLAKNAGSGAVDSCAKASVASSTGFYALEELRDKCDNEINSCKTSCTEATEFIKANKERSYQTCRKKVYEAESCLRNSSYDTSSEAAFNINFDRVHKSEFDNQIQQMENSATENLTKCENGTALTNRQKMSKFMNDLNDSVKNANQCQCQLSSNGQDCNNQVGPAECRINSALPGCIAATVNCLSPSDISLKCVCFRNPNSQECLNYAQVNAKVGNTQVSAFVGPGALAQVANISGVNQKAGAGAAVDVGDLSGLNSSGEAVGTGSGTASVNNVSPFGVANGGGGSGGGAGGGGFGNSDGVSTANDEDGSNTKKLSGFFNVAKSAIGNLFNKASGTKGRYGEANSHGKNSDNANFNPNGIDSKNWRPRGMVRGLAGNTEIAGKFDDIWKAINKQYKIQDQKDSFIFGGDKK